MTDSTAFENALHLGRLGFSVFPCDGRWADRWADRATSDLTLLAAFGRIDPSANWRVRTGRAFGLLVLDTKRATDWQELIDTYGKPPLSWAVRRGTAGLHRWFATDANDPELRVSTPLIGTHAHFKPSAPIAGSINPKTKERFDWLAGFSPEFFELARLNDQWIEAMPKAGDSITSRTVRRYEWTPSASNY